MCKRDWGMSTVLRTMLSVVVMAMLSACAVGSSAEVGRTKAALDGGVEGDESLSSLVEGLPPPDVKMPTPKPRPSVDVSTDD